MNIVLFGPQGSGKGTQAALISERFGLYHLSVGDELRKEIKKGTPFGKKVAAIINKGNLLPDEMTNRFVVKISKQPKCRKGIIFDGYPRRKAQFDFLISHFTVAAAIEIHVREKESLKRISSRRVCSGCGANFNVLTLKPKKKDVCDVCGGKLIIRADDHPKEILKRLQTYYKETYPIKKFYHKHKLLHEVNGEQSIERVSTDIATILRRL